MATKKHLIEKLSHKLEYLSSDDISYAVDSIVDSMKEELINGNRIEIRGFGSLSIRKRKYADRNEEYNTIYYRMSKNVQEDLN